MKIEELDQVLKENLEEFVSQIQSDVEAVRRREGDLYLNEYDMDNIGRHVFHLFTDFKDNIIKYLKAQK